MVFLIGEIIFVIFFRKSKRKRKKEEEEPHGDTFMTENKTTKKMMN